MSILPHEEKEMLELFCLQTIVFIWRQNSSKSPFGSWGKIKTYDFTWADKRQNSQDFCPLWQNRHYQIFWLMCNWVGGFGFGLDIWVHNFKVSDTNWIWSLWKIFGSNPIAKFPYLYTTDIHVWSGWDFSKSSHIRIRFWSAESGWIPIRKPHHVQHLCAGKIWGLTEEAKCGGLEMAPHVNKWSPVDGAHE